MASRDLAKNKLLLLMLDRTRSLHLHLTQKLIAQTLGMRRESVNEIAGRLTRASLPEIFHFVGSDDG